MIFKEAADAMLKQQDNSAYREVKKQESLLDQLIQATCQYFIENSTFVLKICECGYEQLIIHLSPLANSAGY